MAKRPIARIDFETRSACNIKKHGAYKYSLDRTTDILCLAYQLPGFKKPKLWHRSHPELLIGQSPTPFDLFHHIRDGGLVEAHYAFFERSIWTNIAERILGWYPIKPDQWRCSAAKAAAASLPRDLDGACRAAGLPIDQQKDKIGNAVMRKVSTPKKPTKKQLAEWQDFHPDEPYPLIWHEDEADFQRTWDYCIQDVVSQKALSEKLPDLSPDELKLWQIDQEMNWRGVYFDIDMAKAALQISETWKTKLNEEFYHLTGINSATRRAAVKHWLQVHERVDLPDMRADTLEFELANPQTPISDRARRVMEITVDVNRTSTRKYTTMINHATKDHTVHDLLMFHGANTGRWTGRGIQVHNLPARDLIVKDFPQAADDIKSADTDWCEAMYGDVMRLLSHALRGAIIPKPGRQLMAADYSAIEARVVLWLAGAEDAMRVFREGGDIYCDLASSIYNIDVNKNDHPNERQFGKQAILGLGYGMGYITFLLTCRKYGIRFTVEDAIRILGHNRLKFYAEQIQGRLWPGNVLPGGMSASEFKSRRIQAKKDLKRLQDARENPRKLVHELAIMRHVIDVYRRQRYPEVPTLWSNLETAAIAAVSDPGCEITTNRTTWYVDDDWLCCMLPSERVMRYRYPEVRAVETSWGETRHALTYMSISGVDNNWRRTHTYGGKLAENVTQAAARDVLGGAIRRTAASEIYDPIMHVHDELVAEVDEGQGSIEEFERLIAAPPIWAEDCPIAAEGKLLTRYGK